MLHQNFTTVNLDGIRDSLQLPYLDGLMGYEFFKHYIVQIDYPKRIVHIFLQEEYTPDRNFKEIPFTLYRNQVPKINAFLDQQEGEFILDTGDRSRLTIFSRYADLCGIRQRYPISDTLVNGFRVGGAVYAQLFTPDSFSFSGINFTKVPARIPTATTGGFVRTDLVGSIGNAFFVNFTVCV